MSVSNNDRRTVVAASGGQTALTADYILYATDEVTVTRTRAGVDTVLVLTTDYTVSGLSTPAGFTVTLNSGATAGDTYTIEGTRLERSTAAFSTGGDFTATEVNLYLDYAAVERQEIRRDVDDLMDAIGDLDAAEVILTGDLTAGYIPMAQDSLGTLTESAMSQSGTLVTLTGTFNVSGVADFDGLTDFNAGARVIGTAPTLTFDENDAAANTRLWNWRVETEQMRLTVYSDDLLTANDVVRITRSTSSIGTWGFQGAVTVGGTLGVTGAVSLTVPLSVANGGTGITSGTSGGVPYFSGASTLASSAALGATQLVMGGGAGAAPNTNANLYYDGVTLHVRYETNGIPEKGFRATYAGDTTLASGIRVEKARNTLAAPAAVGQYQAIGSFDVAPYVNGSYQYMGGLRTSTQSVPSGNWVGTQTQLWTSDGSTGTFCGLFVDQLSHVGIGTAHTDGGGGLGFPTYTTATDWIDVRVDGAVLPPKLRLSYADNAVYFPALNLVRMRGTHASPTAVIDTTILGGIDCWGYQNAGERLAGRQYFAVNGTPSGNFVPTSWTLQLGTDAAVPTDAVVVSAAKNMTVTGTITASNFSGTITGTNTGDVTLAGETYISIAGQVITAADVNLPSHVTGPLPVANGGTGITNGTSGGVLYYSAAGTLASSAALANNGVVTGGGAGAAPQSETNLTFDGSALVVTGTAQVTGVADFDGLTDFNANARIIGTEPTLTFDENDAAANNRLWNVRASAQVFELRLYTDDLLTSNAAISVARSGATVGTITLGGAISQLADTDVTNIFGRARIDSRASDQTYFSHYDMSTVTTYAVRQNASGYTRVNGASGQGVDLRVNDTNVVVVTSTGVAVTGTLSTTGNCTLGDAGTDSHTVNGGLTVTSTTLPFIVPRMTTAQKNAVGTPTSGSVVYDTTLGKLCIYGAAAWETVTSV